MEPLRRPPITFAHRGARAHAPENTLAAFLLALRLGASGLESDVWLTADGIPTLDHDGRIGPRIRRRPIAVVRRAGLPPHVPTLADLYAECGTGFELSLDLNHPDTAGVADAVVATARSAGGDAVGRLWLCHPDLDRLAELRARWPEVHLVNSTRLRQLRHGAERRAAQLADAGIDAVNLHHTDWSAGLTTLFHRFERLAFAWDAQHERVLRDVVRMGIDGVYSDHVDRMVEVVGGG